MTNLFETRSKKQQLLDFILSRNWTKTSDVCRWAVLNFSNRAVRNAQAMCREGLFRRMTEEEKQRYFGGRLKEDVWCRNDFV